MEHMIEPTPKKESGTGITLMSLFALYVLVCLCVGGMFLFVGRQNIPVVRDYFPTISPTPSITPRPTITPTKHQPASEDRIIRDDFVENSLNWHSKWTDGNVSIKDGQLVLSVSQADKLGVTQCKTCGYLHDKFYIEAEFSTSQSINEGYGLAFNISDDYRKFYLFQINAQRGYYILYKKNKTADNSKNIWMKRLSRSSNVINPYPKSNKLAVSFRKDSMELYINDTLVGTYQDPGTALTSGEFGFYVDNTGFQLLVDNLFTYGK